MDNSEIKKEEKSFKGQNLENANFSSADLRGTDFTGAVLTDADFSKCKTGLKTSSAVLVFLFSLIISLFSGYIAMLTGMTVQLMIKTPETVTAGYITVGLMLIFIILAFWKGGKNTLVSVAVTIIAVLLIGLIFFLSGAGTGMGSIYGSLALILFVLMVFAGTIARATAGTLSSNIIFLIVAVGGSIFSKSLGGGLGTVVLAIACAIISKRILSGSADFSMVRNIALKVGTFFGTSFKNADLTGANFSESIIKNTNFKGAKLSGVNWGNAKKVFSLEDEN
jgi:hypothetical protein